MSDATSQARTAVYQNDLVYPLIIGFLSEDRKAVVNLMIADKRSFEEGHKVLYRQVKEDVVNKLWDRKCSWVSLTSRL